MTQGRGTRSLSVTGSVLVVASALATAGCKRDGSDAPPTPVGPTSSPEPTVTPGPLVAAPPPPDAAPPEVRCNASASRAALARKPRNKKGEPRIIGGRPSTWPFAVAITSNGTQAGQFCGGSLISPDAVLTAAHCQVATTDKVILGRTDLTATGTGRVVAISEVRNHAAYDQDTHDNDVAVLKLVEPVTFAPLALYAAASELAGEKALVVGWGYLVEDGATSPKLMEVEIPIVTNAACSAGYASDRVGITPNMLCAGLPQGGKDSCQGDSGGPLVIATANGGFQQVGIVSFGVGCARPNKYGVYTRVSSFAPWIEACSR